jgi:hypothetical protein
MNNNFQLTDDEVVAAALSLGNPWPHVLPSVDLESRALLDANDRGARSLVVRKLAQSSSEGFAIDGSLSSLVSRACGAPATVMAYIADNSNPQLLVGTSVFAFLSDQELSDDVLDIVSPGGIHDLAEMPRNEAVDLFLRVINAAFVHGVTRADNSEMSPVFLVKSTLSESWMNVSQASVEFGVLNTGDAGSFFAASSSSNVWDVAQIKTALGLDALV